jgi:hypothetical protein
MDTTEITEVCFLVLSLPDNGTGSIRYTPPVPKSGKTQESLLPARRFVKIRFSFPRPLFLTPRA